MMHEKWVEDVAHARLVTGLVGYALNVPEEEVRAATRRKRNAAFARQVAMYLAHAGLGMSLSRVAYAFGRDRSTVAHACHLVEDKRDDAEFDEWVGALEDSARAAPSPLGPDKEGAQ